MKKKGDLARQLLAAKEDELRGLGEQLAALRLAEKQRSEEQAAPMSPLPGPVTGAALAAMTPVQPPALGSASLEVVDLSSSSSGSIAAPHHSALAQRVSDSGPLALATSGLGGLGLSLGLLGTGTGAGAGAGTAQRGPRGSAEEQANKSAALRQQQKQIALLMGENQALKMRLQQGAEAGSTGGGSGELSSLEREQYLRQAFCALFRAKEGIEMQNLARVMCAILGLNEQQQGEVLERCEVLGTVNAAQSAVTDFSASLSQQISSLFA